VAPYYPDVTVACDEIAGDSTVIKNPRIVVEVLSPGTPSFDTVEKREGYRSLESLDAYVIVDTHMRRVEVDYRHTTGAWLCDYYDCGDALIRGAQLPVNEIYAGTSLDGG
jgi:Uma2 family endonuclease